MTGLLCYAKPLAHRAACVPKRSSIVVQFVKWGVPAVLEQLIHPDPAPTDTHGDAEDSNQKYRAMLQKGEECTFNCPSGQLFGRAGRRCCLEDGERLLDWCCRERPDDLAPRVVLLRNLMKQGLGRERDVPWLAVKALAETNVSGCDISSSCYIQVLQIVLLGLKALHKLELEAGITPLDPNTPSFTLDSFLAVAQQAVPHMAYDVASLSERLRRYLVCSCSSEARKRLLSDRNGYMCCIDLQAVSGEHHAGGVGVGVVEGHTAGLSNSNPRALEQALD